MATAAFDRLASTYDGLWTDTAQGRLQRKAVWRHIDPLFPTQSRILDLGCGTGEDALHFTRAGIRVSAFDISPAMVDAARQRGVDASVLAIEDLNRLEGRWDGAISNFGALNCIADPGVIAEPLARLIRPGGYLALCVFGKFCLRETLHFLFRGQLRKATRRWTVFAHSASLDIDVYYPSARQIQRALAPAFVLMRTAGIGFSDHRLLIFRRREA
jgi:SAM-dependent methyltransferase